MRFIHAADFHLDSAFGALTPEKAMQRRQEGRELLSKLADYANEHQVELVLLAGDLFDSDQSFSQTGQALATALAQMKAQVVIAPGNHDFCGKNSPYTTLEWPDNVHIFKTSVMETIDFPQWNISVSGAGFTSYDQVDSFLTGWSAPQDGRVHLGVLHGEVQPAEQRYNPMTKDEIAQSGLHYLALGHIHKRSKPTRYGQTLCAQPGCLEGHGFDELGEKGFYLGDVDLQGEVKVKFVPFARRRHEIITVDVTGELPLQAVTKALPDQTEPHLYRIILTGETQVEGVDLASLTQVLSPRFFTLDVRDTTTIAQDIWALAREDSLRGLFLQELQGQLTTAKTDQERHTITMAARYGLAALDNREML